MVIKTVGWSILARMCLTVMQYIIIMKIESVFKMMNLVSKVFTRFSQGRKDKARLPSLQLLMTEIERALDILGFQVPTYFKVLHESRFSHALS